MTQAILPEYQKSAKKMTDEELENLVAMLRDVRAKAVTSARKGTTARAEKKTAKAANEKTASEKAGRISRAEIDRIAATLPPEQRAAFIASLSQ
jgi:predicted DNA-binding transcriptional regulator YafY